MKACVVQELSGTSGMSYLDVPDAVPGAGQVLIDVRAGVCYPDLLLSKGEYQLRLEPPFTPGMEVAGLAVSLLVTYGFAAGGIPAVKVNRLLLRSAGVLGVGFGECVRRHPEMAGQVTAGLAGLIAGGLKPPPPVHFPLSEGSRALQTLDDGGVYGKPVLEP